MLKFHASRALINIALDEQRYSDAFCFVQFVCRGIFS